MPFGYGGGVTKLSHIEKLFSLGVEKVIINSAAFLNPELIVKAVKIFGSQSLVVSMDVKKSLFGGYEVYVHNGRTKTKITPLIMQKKCKV